MAQVVDYSYAHPTASTIADAGYVGAMRYLGWDYGKGARCISPSERDRLFSAGLNLGLVWETTANMTLRGSAGGVTDGQEANRLADSLGYPKDRPIFYAVDFDAVGSQVETIREYMEAAATTGRPVGVYGKYDIVEYFGKRGYKWLWQCAAWSGFGSGSGGSAYSPADGGRGRRLSSFSCLYQHVGYVLGNTCDFNDVLKDDWGQWKYSGATTTTPTPSLPQNNNSEDKMKAVYKFPNSTEIWMLCSGYVADAEVEDDNGTPQPATINRVTEYFRLIPGPEDLSQLYADGHLKPGFVRQMAAGDDALDAYWHRLPHVR